MGRSENEPTPGEADPVWQTFVFRFDIDTSRLQCMYSWGRSCRVVVLFLKVGPKEALSAAEIVLKVATAQARQLDHAADNASAS